MGVGAKPRCARTRTPRMPLLANTGTPHPSPEPEAWGSPAWSEPCLPGPRKQRAGKSDNFSPQLDLIFFFDAPTAGGRIAEEKQVRRKSVTSEESGGSVRPSASREQHARTHTLAVPGIGVYSALTAKLMTTPDPSRCSGEPSRPRGPRG